MSILSDANKFLDYKNKIPKIQGPEELQGVIQKAKDLAETYAYDLKGIPRELNKWKEYLENISFYSNNTENPTLSKNNILTETKSGAENTCSTASNKLIARMAEIEAKKQPLENKYFIGDVGIDYLFNPNPSYSTSTISQPIVTNESPERLNEDAENDNTAVLVTIILKGDNREANLNKLLEYRSSKTLVKCVFNKVYESMLITSINPEYSGLEGSLKVSISFENLFIATVRRSKEPLEAFKTSAKATTSVGKTGTKFITIQDAALTQS